MLEASLTGAADLQRNAVGLAGAVGPFTVSVLQTFDPSTSDQTIERVESLWKHKLGARLVSYNRN